MPKIIFTNPEGVQYTPSAYENISINESIDQKIKDFSMSLTVFNENQLKQMTVGSIVELFEPSDHLIFRGIVQETPKTLDSIAKKYQISGFDELAKTQTIIVNENYENELISDIVLDLLTKYLPEELTIGEIQPTQYKTSVKLSNQYLFTALEKLAEAVNFTFSLDLRRFNFYEMTSKTSSVTLKEDMFYKGSASFSFDSSRLVNRLHVYGGASLSDDTVQTIVSDGLNSTFALLYKPRAASTGNVEITVNDVPQILGADNLNTGDAVDVLLNYQEKNIKFQDPLTKQEKILPQGDIIRVKYRIEQNLYTILSDGESINRFGLRENIVSYKEITSRTSLIERGREYLNKYSKPITSGSLKSWKNDWETGELVKIEIMVQNDDESGWFINEWLQLSSKTITITPKKSMEISYSYETKPKLSNLIKQILERLKSLEESTQNEIVEQLDNYSEQVRGIDPVFILNEINPAFRIGKSRIGEAI